MTHADLTFKGGAVRLIHGDCLEVVPPYIDADAIVSDPPYGIAHVHSGCKVGRRSGKHDRRHSEAIIGDDQPFDPAPWLQFKTVALFGANHFAARLPHGRWFAWDKLAGMESFDSFSDVEFAWINSRGADRIYSYLWKGICQQGEKDELRLHPTQKPVAVMARLMEVAKIPQGATVLDPYMGSGTTGIACLRTGRKFIGIEMVGKHFQTAV